MTHQLDFHHFPKIDSTNNWAKSNIAHFNPKHFTIITAGEQTAGKGRQGRPWLSPPDVNLYVSYVLFVPNTRDDINNIPQIIILATVQTLHKLGFKAQIKWPNDIVINGKKLGGTLCETLPVKESTAVIVGLGINVNMSQEWLSEVDNAATSLKTEKGGSLDLIATAEAIQDHVIDALDIYLKKGFTPFIEPFRQHLVHKIGDPMRFHHGNNLLEGSFHSINNDGTLNLILNDKVQSFASGEIV